MDVITIILIAALAVGLFYFRNRIATFFAGLLAKGVDTLEDIVGDFTTLDDRLEAFVERERADIEEKEGAIREAEADIDAAQGRVEAAQRAQAVVKPLAGRS